MNQLTATIKKSFIVFIASSFMALNIGFGFSPLVSASETPASTIEASVTYAPCPPVSGTNKPTGADAHMYTQNPATCDWENAYYTWSTSTKLKTAKYDQTSILNAAGTAWEYVDWHYSPAAGAYQRRVISIPVPQAPTPPAGQNGNNIPGVNSAGSPAVNGIAGEGSRLGGGSTVGNTGPNSSNNLSGAGNNNVNLNTANNTNILTTLNSSAVSGDAYILQNTNGGSASTGDAEAIANYLNMIQSAWNPAGGIATFNAGIYGNYFGDLQFSPQSILDSGPNSTNSIANNTDSDININSVDNASITNNINLEAISGDATVSQNTNAGDATTGDATAVANIINMINSRINTGESFIGNLNIYGDLVGDLLLPSSILAQLQNTGPYSTNQIANNQTTNVDANIDQNYSITNNLDLAATSGNAVVDSNTNAGNASSGNASTSAQQANLIGQNTNGSKGLLVFVNVLGKWVGTLWGQNTNSSINGTGPYSNNSINNNSNTNIDANYTENYSIENNIDLNSQSGDATVASNTNAGNATTGDASSSVNLINLINSDINFDDWFGVLFINVFGSWDGSFGVDTASGDTPKSNAISSGVKSNAASSGSTPTSATESSASTASKVTSNIRSYVARTTSATASAEASTTVPSDSSTKGAVSAPTASADKAASAAAATTDSSNLPSLLVFGGLALLTIAAFNIKRIGLLVGSIRK